MISKKITLIITLIITTYNVTYAAMAIKFFNLSGSEIDYLYLAYEHTSYKMLNYTLNNNKSVYLNALGEIEIDRKFNINIRDTHKKCSYIELLSNKIPNGWELDIYINSIYYGKVCATKLFLLDPYVHAAIDYFVTESHYNFKIYNTGVKQNSSVFLNINLEKNLYN